MALCDILDFRCIFVSELVGSIFLAMLILVLGYFIIAGKLKWGFDTTMSVAFPILLIAGLALAGFSAIMAFSTVILSLMFAWLFNRIIGN